jgi:ABC transporter substrate binding protein
MRRRQFIAGLGSAAAWPVVARAQQGDRVRRIGVLLNKIADDPLVATERSVFVDGLQQFGWTEGGNVRIDYRFGAGNPETSRKFAAELLALAPDVILADGASTLSPLQRATRSVPIVFVGVTLPIIVMRSVSLAPRLRRRLVACLMTHLTCLPLAVRAGRRRQFERSCRSSHASELCSTSASRMSGTSKAGNCG